jgi:hypothetical protein
MKSDVPISYFVSNLQPFPTVLAFYGCKKTRIQSKAVNDFELLPLRIATNDAQEFNHQKYKPHIDIIQSMTDPARKKAVTKANSYF